MKTKFDKPKRMRLPIGAIVRVRERLGRVETVLGADEVPQTVLVRFADGLTSWRDDDKIELATREEVAAFHLMERGDESR